MRISDRHLWLRGFPAFSSWSSARKRVALATVSDSPVRPLHEIVPTDAMAFTASYGGDNADARCHIHTRYTPATCAWNAPIIREFRRMRNPPPLSLPPSHQPRSNFSPGFDLSLLFLPSLSNAIFFLFFSFFFLFIDNPEKNGELDRNVKYFFSRIFTRTGIDLFFYDGFSKGFVNERRFIHV